VHIYLETCAFLPSPQVQAPQFPVYISHFLINCKKRQTPEKGFALIGKRYHNFLAINNLSDIAAAATTMAW
jgi:hypothetical protein